MGMHKTTLIVDDEKLRKARRILGTSGIRDTIDRALDEVLALEARRRELDRLRKLSAEDLKRMEEAWR